MKMAGRFRISMPAKGYGAVARTGRALCFNPPPPRCGSEPIRSRPAAESNGPNSRTLCWTARQWL